MEALTEKVNPYWDLVGADVPSVSPAALKDFWKSAHDLWVYGLLLDITRDKDRLETFTLYHRMTLLRMVRFYSMTEAGAQWRNWFDRNMPTDAAFATVAVIPLKWPNTPTGFRFDAGEFATLCGRERKYTVALPQD